MSIDCVAIGDEIALNVGSILQCEQRTQSGVTSSKAIELAGGVYHAYCIVSIGSYDPTSSKLARNMNSIRNRTTCTTYVWLVPANATATAAETSALIDTADKQIAVAAGVDGIHPTSYSSLASQVLAVTGN